MIHLMITIILTFRMKEYVADFLKIAEELTCILEHSFFREHDLLPDQRVLILCARQPAPKPLSMFMTAMPGTQELSIAKSAVRPPRLVP